MDQREGGSNGSERSGDGRTRDELLARVAQLEQRMVGFVESAASERALRWDAERTLEFLGDFEREIATQDLGKVISRGLAFLSEQLEIPRCSVALTREDGPGFLVFDTNLPITGLESGAALPPGSASLDETVRERRQVYRKDLRHWPVTSPVDEQLLAAELRCTLSTPLMVARRCVGSLNAAVREADGIPAAHRELLSLVAPRFAQAIQTAIAVEALAKSEERMRAIVEHSPDHVMVLNRDLRYELVLNPPLGLTAAQMRGKTDAEVLPEADTRHVAELERHALETGEITPASVSLPNQRGQLEFFEGAYVPRRDAAGHVDGLIAYFRNVTERKQAEEALREREYLLSESQRIAHIGTWSWTPPAGTLQWSAETYRLYGVDPSDFEPSVASFLELIHPDDRRAMSEWIRACSEGERAGELDFRVVRPDGTVRVLRGRGEMMAATDERPSRMNGTVQDVTERKQVEDALRDVDRRKNEFLGMLSHELRNPLAPIRNSLYILDRVPPGGDQARRARSVIDRQVTHLTRLIDDLLDVTRITRGKIRLKLTRLDLGELVRRAVDDHRGLLEDHVLEVALPERPVWVDGDPTRLAQVIGNLLGNAAKFTPKHERVSVSLGQAAGRALLKVADTGMGIDSDTLTRLFEPFAQADRSLDRSAGGLGLGLALVKGLVELHGGEVSARSDGPGKGARFAVELPLAAEVASAATVSDPAPQRGGTTRRRVLVIEDCSDAANSLAESLELSGHEVAVAHDGVSGLAMARESVPEIVLCDIGLPGGMDGYAVARALRRESAMASAYLVALTGYAQPEDLRRALEAGFDAHVAKPPDPEALGRLLAHPHAHGAQPANRRE